MAMDTSEQLAIIKDGWFIERTEYSVGEGLTMKIDEVLYREKSQFQEIMIFKNETFGRVLVLDGTVQVTEKDECAYHECIAHIPLFSHPNPRTVLVVGGGDGGVLREVAKHSTVEEIHICEIDQKVIDASKKYLPQTAVGYSNPKVKLHVQDGVKFIEEYEGKFDVIITDSSDCCGLARFLFEKPYHEMLKDALNPGGIICSQADETIWMEGVYMEPVITNLWGVCKNLFPVTAFAMTSLPSYPGGTCTFVLASTNGDTVFEKPLRRVTEKEADEMNLQYYDSEVHSGAFVLPRFAKKMFKSLKDEGDSAGK